jgi:hypothetical protein
VSSWSADATTVVKKMEIKNNSTTVNLKILGRDRGKKEERSE